MPFQVGDFFGKFSLVNKINRDAGLADKDLSRWEANDTQSGKTVILDIVERKSESNWFNTSMPAEIAEMGYDQTLGCFFWVWKDRDKAQVEEVSTEGLSLETALQVVESLNQITLTLNEKWGKEPPKPYLFNDSHIVLFYQKELTAEKDDEINKKIMLGWIDPYLPKVEPVEDNLPPGGGGNGVGVGNDGGVGNGDGNGGDGGGDSGDPTPLSKWLLVIFGVLLVGFLLWKWGIPPSSSPPDPSVNFNLALDNGISAYKKNDDKQAEKYFKEAADYAKSINPKPSRLDSLANSFRNEADDKCAQFKAAQSPSLFYIPNQSYKFVEILTGEPCQTCK